MMEAGRTWLLSVLVTCVLCAAADGLMPPGGVRQVGRLVCGLVLLWAMAAAGRVLYLLALAGGTAVLVIGTWGLLRLLKRRNRQADESVVIALAVCVGLIFLAILGSSLIPLSPL